MKVNPQKLPDRVPAAALRFAADLSIGTAGDDGTVPVTIKARSARPIDHYYWGRIVHDMSGMIEPKPTIPLDYDHYEAMGFADQYDAGNDGLTVVGKLVPFQADDRASEVIFRQSKGVPYEGSINWMGDGILLESVPDGAVTQVNGYQFEGPGIVVRRWPLRGVAITLYGADANTAVQFSQSPPGHDSAGQTVPVTYQEFSQMSVDTKPAPAATNVPATETTEATSETKPAAAETKPAETSPAAQPATPPAEATQLSAAPGQMFLDAFGDAGALYFAQGKSFEEAQKLFRVKVAEDLKKVTDENTQLKAQLFSLKGEPRPLSSSPAEAQQNGDDKSAVDAKARQFSLKGANTNQARFAAGLKLPK